MAVHKICPVSTLLVEWLSKRMVIDEKEHGVMSGVEFIFINYLFQSCGCCERAVIVLARASVSPLGGHMDSKISVPRTVSMALS